MNADDGVKLLLAELEQLLAAEPLDRLRVLSLIARGANPNARDEWGSSWFEEKVGDISIPVVELLIEAGADVNSDGGDGTRPLWQAASLNARPELVECLLARGADPNFMIDRGESLLDHVEFDLWYCEDNIGTAWEQEYQQARVECLRRIVELLQAAGAKPLSAMRAPRLRAWVTLGAGSVEEVLTGDGYIRLSEIAGLSDDWIERWRAWCAANFDPAEENFLAAPPGFDRRRYNAEGLVLVREFKRLAGDRVRVDVSLIDPDSEEAFAQNCHVIADVGGAERHPSLPFPHARYVKEPGFHVVAKARVGSDFSAVMPILEFYVGGQRCFSEWTLQLSELERSCDADGPYVIFSDTSGIPVDVWVAWASDEVRWHIPRIAQNLAFRREGYREATSDAARAAHHVVRRAWIAVDKHRNRIPQITGLGTVEPAIRTGAVLALPREYVLRAAEEQLALQSRLWEGCVRCAWCVNSRSLAALDDRVATHCVMSGDRRPGLHGKQNVLDYLAVAITDAALRHANEEIVAEIGHFWLTAEPCVIFWQGDARVSLANVHTSSEGEITAIHYISAPDLVASVERRGIYPGREPEHQAGSPRAM